MFEKFFNIHIFEKERNKNHQYLNHHEILSQFSYINFDELFIDIDAIVNHDVIFDKSEFNNSMNQSSLFFFLRNCKSMFGINIIYTGYILKTILFILLKNFSKKVIPFKTMDNIRNYSERHKKRNIWACGELRKQKNYSMDIDDFCSIYLPMLNLLNEKIFDNDEMVEWMRKFYFHYYENIIPNKIFLYILRPKDFEHKMKLTKKISKVVNINFDIFKTLTYDALFSINECISKNNINLSKELINSFDQINSLIEVMDNLYKEENIIEKIDISSVIKREEQNNEKLLDVETIKKNNELNENNYIENQKISNPNKLNLSLDDNNEYNSSFLDSSSIVEKKQ